MKKELLLLAILLIFTSGCRHILPVQPNQPLIPDKPVETTEKVLEEAVLQEEVPEQRISDDGILHFSQGDITLLAYEDEMDFVTILGSPDEEETRILENADTFTGSFEKTLVYQDATLILFSPAQDGERFYLISIDSNREDLATNRGISLGDPLEKVQLAYPEMTRSLDGTFGTDGRYEMMFDDHIYSYLYIFIENGAVSSVQLYHEFP